MKNLDRYDHDKPFEVSACRFCKDGSIDIHGLSAASDTLDTFMDTSLRRDSLQSEKKPTAIVIVPEVPFEVEVVDKMVSGVKCDVEQAIKYAAWEEIPPFEPDSRSMYVGGVRLKGSGMAKKCAFDPPYYLIMPPMIGHEPHLSTMETGYHYSNNSLEVTVVPRGSQPFAGMSEDLALAEWRTRNAAVDRGVTCVQRALLLLRNYDLDFEGKKLAVIGIEDSERAPRMFDVYSQQIDLSEIERIEKARGKSVRQVHEKGQIADLQLRNPQNYGVASDGSVFVEDFETAKDLQDFDVEVRALYVINDLFLAIGCLVGAYVESAPAFSDMEQMDFEQLVSDFLSSYFSEGNPALIDDLALDIAALSSLVKERLYLMPFLKRRHIEELSMEIRGRCFPQLLELYKQSELNNVCSADHVSEEDYRRLLVERNEQVWKLKEEFQRNKLMSNLLK